MMITQYIRGLSLIYISKMFHCVKTHLLFQNPLPKREFRFPHSYPTTEVLWTILGLPDLAFVRYGLRFRLSHYAYTSMGYDLCAQQ